MEIYHSIEAIRNAVAAAKAAGKTVGFVPTMGALHDGHLNLVRQAQAENAFVVVSIFVNPTQFNDAADLQAYPRDLERDAAMLEAIGVDAVFAPSANEMYPAPMRTCVDVPDLTERLIGKIRPGHFQGMAGVVIKLFNIVAADRAYFGEKDYQQLAIIRQFVFDLNIPIEIIGVPIVREADGLAMSSRNARLSAEDRAAATVLYSSILAAQAALASGERNVAALRALVAAHIAKEPRAELLSADIVDAQSLEAIDRVENDAVLLLNVKFGEIILIDQGALRP